MSQNLITCPMCKGLGLIDPSSVDALTPRQAMDLRAVFAHHNIWPKVPPGTSAEIDHLAHRGMIIWTGKGYEITEAGRSALERSEG